MPLYTLHNSVTVLVQIANKMGFKKKLDRSWHRGLTPNCHSGHTILHVSHYYNKVSSNVDKNYTDSNRKRKEHVNMDKDEEALYITS
jgi:hypothetical protein